MLASRIIRAQRQQLPAVFEQLRHAASVQAPGIRASDPNELSPVSAWMLMSRPDKFPDAASLRASRAAQARGYYDWEWTAAAQSEPGDLLFYYFNRPLSEVHFVGRAVTQAAFNHESVPGSNYRTRQWWIHSTTPIQIKPVSLAQLREITGHEVLSGSSKYLRPDHANALCSLMEPLHANDRSELARVLRPVIGRSDLPDPSATDLNTWRSLPAGALALEADVRRHIVEPLLRLMLVGIPVRAILPEFRIARSRADYAVTLDGQPVAVIEAKIKIDKSPTQSWRASKDFQQAARYGRALNLPALLVDAFEMLVIAPGATEPSLSLTRSGLTEADLDALRHHLLS